MKENGSHLLDKNIIIAHRGIYNNIDIPENSLLAFKEALKFNYPIELDINITKDNVIVVFHDDNLLRMTNLDKGINNITYNEIKNLSLLDTKEKIPTLEEVLKLIKGKVLLNIEIKKTNNYKVLIDNLIKLLNKYNGKYIIQSFDYKCLLYLKNNYPNIIRGLLISGNNNKIHNYICNIIYIKICKINFISISKKLINNKKYLKYMNNYPTYIWTIKSKEELDKYMNKYNGYICDNLPYKENSN